MAAESLTPTIPPEIVGEILSSLSDDQSTLQNCALISQEWLFESRPLLFRSIDILSQETGDLFVSKVLHSERLQPWLSSIRHLAFTEQEAFIVDISERLSNIRSIKWGYIFRQWDALHPEVFSAFAKFAYLRDLEITRSSFASFGDLKKIITAFPALSSLTLSGVGWMNSAGPAEPTHAMTPAHIPPKLSKLSISDRDGEAVLLWLSTTSTRHLLRELSFDLYNTPAALRLMAGTSFAAVRIAVYDDNDEVELLRDDALVAQVWPLLSQVRDIEVLSIYFPDSWTNAAAALRLFGSFASVRRLHLCLSWGPPDSGTAESGRLLAPLDAILARSENNAFRALRAVEFAWYVVGSDETLREQHPVLCAWVRRTLPQLHERRVVEVYAYNEEFVFGPTGLAKRVCMPDLPHARRLEFE